MLFGTLVVLLAGTIGFRAILHESWLQSFYRAVVPASRGEATGAAGEGGVLFIGATGPEDEALLRAGLARARGFVASSDSDADTLYIVLPARAARPDLAIVARGSDVDAERKLKLAG